MDRVTRNNFSRAIALATSMPLNFDLPSCANRSVARFAKLRITKPMCHAEHDTSSMS